MGLEYLSDTQEVVGSSPTSPTIYLFMKPENRQRNSHYKIINGEFVEKKVFNTENEAIEFARFLNSKPNVIHKMVAYKCNMCGKWHIGNNGKTLFDNERDKYKQKINIFKLVKKIKTVR